MQSNINYPLFSGIALFKRFKKKNITEKCDPLNSLNLKRMKTNQNILKTNLLHLEFINKFESYLDGKDSEHFPLEFYLELETLKRDIQVRTFQTSEKLNRDYAIAI